MEGNMDCLETVSGDGPEGSEDMSLQRLHAIAVEMRRIHRRTSRPWEVDAYTVGDHWLLERVLGAIRALEATLSFHSEQPCTEERHLRWTELTGSSEVTARVLCDTVRCALAGAAVRPGDRTLEEVHIEIVGLDPGANP
jgi:hypothetical protein